MLNGNKVFKKSKKLQIIYGIMIIVVSMFMLIMSINSLVESNKILESQATVKFRSVDELDGSDMIKMIKFKNAKSECTRSIFYLLLSLGLSALMLYTFFSNNIKLVLNDKSIRLYSTYSLYKNQASKEFKWGNIKTIQFGYMRSHGSRIEKYGMKIRYSELKGDNKDYSQIILIRGFNKNKDLIKIIEAIGKKQNTEVFHMDE